MQISVGMSERREEETETLVRRVELKWHVEHRESLVINPMNFNMLPHLKETMAGQLTNAVYGFVKEKLSSMEYNIIKEVEENRDYQFLDRATFYRTVALFSKEINKLIYEIQNHIVVVE